MNLTLNLRWSVLTLLLGFSLAVFARNEKPFVIPELKEWYGGTGEFQLTPNAKIVFPKNNPELEKIAIALSEDIHTMFGYQLETYAGPSKRGDIILALKKEKELGDEGYRMNISNTLKIEANGVQGVYWGTRTLLQIAEQGNHLELPQGKIKDIPDFESRGFMMDCGRKYIPLYVLESYVKIMSYYKMNTLLVHLNDNGFPQFFQEDFSKTYSAFRLESETFPELTAQDGFYTKQEFKDFQKEAATQFVTIVPEIDVPAHSLAFTQYLPELASDGYGMDHLDLFKQETYDFIDALFKEYLQGDDPIFVGKRVHVGTDEYSNRDKAVVEKFRYFTDYCIKLVESYGKEAAIWGALTHAKGDTPVKSENVLLYAWHNNYAQPDEMIEQGFDILSIPDGLLYIVPNAGYYYDFLNIEKLYKTWTPNVVGEKTLAYDEPKLKGGMFAVWNDHVGNGITCKDILVRVYPALQTLSTKMWTGKNTSVDWLIFDEKRSLLSEAPGINELGRIGLPNSLVYELKAVSPNTMNNIEEIGYNYTVTFDIEGKLEEKNTILLSSKAANFYLSDPIKGLLGFSRDGYLDTFNYRIKPGVKVNITIQGDVQGTRLYIDGKLKEDKSPWKQYFKRGDKYESMSYLSTLFFPLRETGNFKSSISNLKVYNYIK